MNVGQMSDSSADREQPGTEWMRTSDVARSLGYSTAWVRQQISKGLLPAQMHSTGKRPSLRIRRADFERFVRETFRST